MARNTTSHATLGRAGRSPRARDDAADRDVEEEGLAGERVVQVQRDQLRPHLEDGRAERLAVRTGAAERLPDLRRDIRRQLRARHLDERLRIHRAVAFLWSHGDRAGVAGLQPHQLLLEARNQLSPSLHVAERTAALAGIHHLAVDRQRIVKLHGHAVLNGPGRPFGRRGGGGDAGGFRSARRRSQQPPGGQADHDSVPWSLVHASSSAAHARRAGSRPTLRLAPSCLGGVGLHNKTAAGAQGSSGNLRIKAGKPNGHPSRLNTLLNGASLIRAAAVPGGSPVWPMARASTQTPSAPVSVDIGPHAAPRKRSGYSALQFRDVGRLGTLRTLADLELHRLPIAERLETLALDGGVVHEEVLRPVLRGDKPIPLLVVEPLHGTLRHADSPPSTWWADAHRHTKTVEHDSSTAGLLIAW